MSIMKIQNLFQTQRTTTSVAKQIQQLTLREERLLHKVNQLKKKRYENKLKEQPSIFILNPESTHQGSKQLNEILNKSIQIQRKKRVQQLHVDNFSRSREARKLIQQKKRQIAYLQSKQSKLHEQRKMLQKQAFLCQKKQYCLQVKKKQQEANRKIQRFINQYTQRAIVQKHQQQAIFRSMKQQRKTRIDELSKLEQSLIQNLKKSDKVLRSQSKMIA